MDPGRFTAASATRSTDLPSPPEDTDPNSLFWPVAFATRPGAGNAGHHPARQISDFFKKPVILLIQRAGIEIRDGKNIEEKGAVGFD